MAIHGHIPESNKKALEALKEKGYDAFICTGRAPYYAENLFGKLVSGIISCNGRYISYKSEKLHGVPFTPVEVEELKKKLDNLGCGGLFVSDTFSSPYHLEGDVLTHVKKEYGEEPSWMPNQYFAALTNMRSVGVMGDERTYDYAVALRAVTTVDFMTAEAAEIPYDVLNKVMSRIINEVKGVNRVFYDLTSKPPGTIEFE